MAATKNRRIHGVTLKCDRAVSGGGVYEAPFRVAFDNVQKNSALHALASKEANIRGAGCLDGV